MTALILIVVATLLSSLGVSRIRQMALANKMIDIPNERSSHQTPTPRGGGLSIVLVTLLGTLALALLGLLRWNIAGAVIAGMLVAAVGFVDDRRDLSPLTRAVVHVLSAATGIALLGGMPPLDLGFARIEWGWLGHLAGVLGIVWMINLYNFMDGIDGLAASEAVFVFGIGGLLLLNLGSSDLVLISALLIGACLGFLRWNWPPAKIFMGDVASGFLGYMIAIMAIASAREGLPLWVWLILIAVFFVDSTVTLLRRMRRGQKWYAAHRSHAYQHLTQRWGSHLRVTLAVWGLNLLWLAPLALVAALRPDWMLICAIVALLPLSILALRLGAGQD